MPDLFGRDFHSEEAIPKSANDILQRIVISVLPKRQNDKDREEIAKFCEGTGGKRPTGKALYEFIAMIKARDMVLGLTNPATCQVPQCSRRYLSDSRARYAEDDSTIPVSVAPAERSVSETYHPHFAHRGEDALFVLKERMGWVEANIGDGNNNLFIALCMALAMLPESSMPPVVVTDMLLHLAIQSIRKMAAYYFYDVGEIILLAAQTECTLKQRILDRRFFLIFQYLSARSCLHYGITTHVQAQVDQIRQAHAVLKALPLNEEQGPRILELTAVDQAKATAQALLRRHLSTSALTQKFRNGKNVKVLLETVVGEHKEISRKLAGRRLSPLPEVTCVDRYRETFTSQTGRCGSFIDIALCAAWLRVSIYLCMPGKQKITVFLPSGKGCEVDPSELTHDAIVLVFYDYAPNGMPLFGLCIYPCYFIVGN
ncbi:MAG: hypothetical protein LBI34_00605 [Puniceicoccales bacterium]|nr:hypothetical protein [Puniceicoccales bacterium]